MCGKTVCVVRRCVWEDGVCGKMEEKMTYKIKKKKYKPS